MIYFERIVKDCRPDCIVIFNGRFFDTAVCIEIAKKYQIDYQIKEVLDGPRVGKPFLIETYFNCSVFDVNNKTEKVYDTWNRSSLPETEKIKIGSQFYERKKSGECVVDKSYVRGQQIGLLPPKWNPQKKNIVIFNSSDDELAAIGADYDSYSLFKSQYAGICSILEHFVGKQDYCFYLRMHPNLSKLDNPFVNDLSGLVNKFDNITVISPAEKISSYSLMDAADKVISFGSTMGVEANYYGKPSILLSASAYHNLGVCYLPSSAEELYEMIKASLPPLSKEGAVKYAFYLQERDVRCHKADFVDISFTKRDMFFKTIYTFSYDRLLNSSFLSRMESLFYRKFLSKFMPGKNEFPEQMFLDNI